LQKSGTDIEVFRGPYPAMNFRSPYTILDRVRLLKCFAVHTRL
jgi:hypothetical protein